MTLVPARRKRHIACDELFHFITKLIARSFCCSSLPNRTRCRWAPVWGRRYAAVLSYREKISILTVPSKIKGHLLCRCPFILGSAAQRGGSTLRYPNARGRQSRPCATAQALSLGLRPIHLAVFAHGENACMAQKRRW